MYTWRRALGSRREWKGNSWVTLECFSLCRLDWGQRNCSRGREPWAGWPLPSKMSVLKHMSVCNLKLWIAIGHRSGTGCSLTQGPQRTRQHEGPKGQDFRSGKSLSFPSVPCSTWIQTGFGDHSQRPQWFWISNNFLEGTLWHYALPNSTRMGFKLILSELQEQEHYVTSRCF